MNEAAKISTELTVVVVSYNTCDLTLKALETLFANTQRTTFRCILYDNASSDGSAEAIAAAFPQVELIKSDDNVGFAAANNIVADTVKTPYLLLLNPDTEVHDGAIDSLMDFAHAHPEAGIWGGRTVFPDGSLNIASCWAKITPWSLFCRAIGFSAIFPDSMLFSPESYGGWERDSVREVDIVVGCFFLIRTETWHQLGGFNLKYYMYGEEADLCLRARDLGYRPMITPDAEIMHLVGASTNVQEEKAIMVMKARATLVRDHWSTVSIPVGLALMWLWAALRRVITAPLAVLPGDKHRTRAERWRTIWRRRAEWLSGY